MDAPATLLQVQDLCVGFGPVGRGAYAPGRLSVDHVSLTVERGEVLGLVGESGSGKTTLARAILRLVEPLSGSVSFEGVDVLSLRGAPLRALRRHMQMVFQDPGGSLNPRMRIGRIIAEPLLIHRVGTPRSRQQRAAELMKRVGLPPECTRRFPHELSGGQKQRVGIARALALSPKLVILDEPVSALDVSIQAQILALLERLRADLGLTYLFIAHNLAVVRRLSDRVAVMQQGRIVELAPAADVFERPRHPYTKALLAAVPGLHPRKKPAPALSERDNALSACR